MPSFVSVKCYFRFEMLRSLLYIDLSSEHNCHPPRSTPHLYETTPHLYETTSGHLYETTPTPPTTPGLATTTTWPPDEVTFPRWIKRVSHIDQGDEMSGIQNYDGAPVRDDDDGGPGPLQCPHAGSILTHLVGLNSRSVTILPAAVSTAATSRLSTESRRRSVWMLITAPVITPRFANQKKPSKHVLH